MMVSKNAYERLSVLSKIPQLAQIDHRHFLDDKGKLPYLENLPRNERRKIDKEAKKIAKKYNRIMRAISRSGAGYPVDNLLRDLAIEYTHRYASAGTGSQPISFNYFESFCNIKLIAGNVAPYAEPVKEVDNLFSVTDYFEFITSADAQNFKLSSLMELPENLAFHYTSNGSVLDFTFLNAVNREFVISGFSMIRRKNSVHWYLLGGEVYPSDEWRVICAQQPNIEVDQIEPAKRAFLKAAITENDNKSGKPLPLEGTETAARTIVSGEIDLFSEKYLGRCIMAEHENSFNINCDDPDIFSHSNMTVGNPKLVSQMIEYVEKASVMWDLVGSMFQLPVYFDSRVTIPKDTIDAAGQKVSLPKYRGGRGVSRQFKKVPSLESSSEETPMIKQISPVYYKAEIEGHWRRIHPSSIGKGPRGDDEIGRTWIKSKNNWREPERTPRPIYVKSTIQAAKLKADAYLNAAQDSVENKEELDNSDHIGVLYVLRCTAMKDEIYKVGWTSRTASERAKELSSNSGVPESFVVVDTWKHADPSALEMNVHAMLDPYRLNDNREFFHAPYNSIKAIIETEFQRSIR